MAASPRARLTKIQESGDINGDNKMVMNDDDDWWR